MGWNACQRVTEIQRGESMERNMQLGVTEANRIVTEHFYGAEGLWLLDVFDAINGQLFGGELPHTLVTLELTAHGGCLGQTHSDPSKPPRIKIHPSVFGGTESANPWKVPEWQLGWRYAVDVLIHEAVHVSVEYLLGGANGPTSHNNSRWRSEIERIAPLIGLEGFKASGSVTRRVETGKLKDSGKPEKKVMRVAVGSLPYAATYCFPYATRRAIGQADFYRCGDYKIDLPKYEA
jgi:hypothetical protein